MTYGWKRDSLPMQTSTSGGSRDTEEKEVTVSAYGCVCQRQVSTATPVAQCASA